MFCIYCGKELYNDAKFCQNCGAKVETSNLFDEPKEEKVEEVIETTNSTLDENNDSDTTLETNEVSETFEENEESSEERIIEYKESVQKKPTPKDNSLAQSIVGLSFVITAFIFIVFWRLIIFFRQLTYYYHGALTESEYQSAINSLGNVTFDFIRAGLLITGLTLSICGLVGGIKFKNKHSKIISIISLGILGLILLFFIVARTIVSIF